MKKGKKGLSEKLIYNNKFVMLISVSLAIIIWVSVKINYSTDITRVVSDVRISLNTSMSGESGFKYFADEDQLYVDVEISGKAYNINSNVIDKDDIIVTASEVIVDSAGYKLLSLSARVEGNGTAQVVSVIPSTIAVYYDREVTDTFNVEARITNDPLTLVNEDYIFSGLIASKQTVEITGPESVLSQLEKVYFTATADKAELPIVENTVFNAEVEYQLNGNAEYQYLLRCPELENSNPKVTVVVKAQKTIPTAIKYVNQPSAYTASDDNITINPSAVRILGNAGSKEERYLIETVDFKKLSNKKNVFEYTCEETQSADKLIDEIELFTVTIDFSHLDSKSFLPADCTVVYVGADDSYEYSLDFSGYENDRIVVIGPAGSLDALSAEMIQIEVNAETLSGAKSNGQVVEISNISIQSEQKNDCWVYGSYTATLVATPKIISQ